MILNILKIMIIFNNTSADVLKFINSEKATKICEISTIDLSYVVPVKYTVKISLKFVAFSE